MSPSKPSLWGSTLFPGVFEEERPVSLNRYVAARVVENEKSYDVEVVAPGFEKKDIIISMENGLLRVGGQKRGLRDHEFGFSSFSRSFNFPGSTTVNDVHAKFEEGILKLSVAKKIKITSSEKKAIEIE